MEKLVTRPPWPLLLVPSIKIINIGEASNQIPLTFLMQKWWIHVCVAAFLVMWPRSHEQSFVPPNNGGSIYNLASKAHRFQRRWCLKMLDDGGRKDDGACLYYKLTHESKGSGELKKENKAVKTILRKKMSTVHATLCDDKNDVFSPTYRSRQKESIIGVQWGQENPNSKVHRSSGKRGFPSSPQERWTGGLGFSGRHWTPMIDSFPHIPLPKSFTNDSSLFEHGSVRVKWAKQNKNSAQSNNFGTINLPVACHFYKGFDNYIIWGHCETFITSMKRPSTTLSSQLLCFWKLPPLLKLASINGIVKLHQ